MAAQKTLEHDLNAALLRHAVSAPVAPIKGHWQAIQLRPDFATGETFNIGVLFTHHGETHSKFIPQRGIFNRIYDKDTTDNFQFLLRLAKSNPSDSASISPHLHLTAPKPAAGNSVDEILDQLYQQVVTLRLLIKEKTSKDSLSSQAVKDAIHAELVGKDPRFIKEYWRSGRQLSLRSGAPKLTLDIFIQTDDLFAKGKQAAANIVSVDYDDQYAEWMLSKSTQDLNLASQILSHRMQGKLLIYRPENQISELIDNLIDKAHYLLKKEKNTCEVSADLQELAGMAYDLAA